MYNTNSLVNSRLELHSLISHLITLRALLQTTTAIKASLSMTNRVFDHSSLPSFLTAKHI
jgi:hypothetical protein